MSVLWRWVIARRLWEERARTTLTLLGVALGVAVFVSIRLASHSAMASFSDTVDAVAGKANLQVSTKSEGFDEGLFVEVRDTPGVIAAAPVVESYVRIRSAGASPTLGADGAPPPRHEWRETLLLLGLDLLSERPFARYRAPRGDARRAALELLSDPRAVVITTTLAKRHGLGLGDTLGVLVSGRPHPLIVRQLLESPELDHALGGNIAIVDIATAQEVLGRFGRLDRIDLLVESDRRDQVRAALETSLPPDVSVALPQGRTRQVENMVRSFDLNLTALSFIAVFVASFLIFNAVGSSVLRWRREIGVLRGVGVTRGEVLRMFLAEGLFFGLAGGALGLVLGTLLARATLLFVSRTLTDLYLVQHAGTLRPDAGVYALGLGIGTLVALVSALAPAIEASRTPPGVTMRRGAAIEIPRTALGGITGAGFAAFVLAAAISYWTVSAHRPVGGFVSAFFVVVGFSLCAPAFTLMCERLADPLTRALTGIEGRLGLRYLRSAVARTSAVVAALSIAVGMMVALTIMVGSFRRTVDTWVTQTVRGDLYVEPVGHRDTGAATRMPDSLVAAAAAIPGVQAVDTYRATRIVYDERPAFAVGIELATQRDHGNLQFVEGQAAAAIATALDRGGILVSESFAHHHRKKRGDVLALSSPTGMHALPIGGVFYDYTSDSGVLLMDRTLYARLWNDERTESMALYLEDGADVTAVRERFLTLAAPDIYSATPNQSLRRRVLAVFDQTFQITFALQAIAILVAVLGVIGALTALILQRGREIGVLRAVGALRRQVRKMVLVESALLGLIGAVLGCLCGVVLALLMIHIINRQFFGWTIQAAFTPGVFVQAIVLMVITAVLAGIGPARLAATRVAAEAMRME